ncbi:MAG TPA: SPOR domain-containing protein [Gallionella sp.]|nr:SPOR domain-containing protein [Gallionella sp.]
MKKIFWVLLLVNVVLYAVMRGNGFGLGEQQVQAQPDLHGDMIRLIPATRSAPVKTLPASRTLPAPAAVSAPVAELPAAIPAPSKAATQPDHPATVAATTKPGTTACLEWGDFSGPDLVRATAVLSTMQLPGKLSRREVELNRGYWVYFPPLRTKAAVNRKISELKALGITDYFVVQGSGHWHNAISLGVFKTKEAAQSYLHGLHGRGVHTARVGERASKLKATLFMLDGVDAVTVANLTALQKDFPGTELNAVPCALTR